MKTAMPWSEWRKLWTVWAGGLIVVLEGLQALVPEWRELLDPNTWRALTIGIAVALLILRNVPQRSVEK